ncbi:hypothetical protein [Bacillus toyonensis]|uniref:hypothetical protein n=1 Tax=Bacillus toyonensis TaxID=155322 RepID=UPI000BF00FE3|nr:hypothetical protein [Bacillus toyonensis]PEL24319.1 hypothetical protein CN624_18185 [Bacillus toyonensis]
MVLARNHYKALEYDVEMQRTAWQTSLIMSASGNYGKKGIDPKKLYKPQYDDMGQPIKSNDGHGAFTPIDRQDKDKKLNELLAKFNKQ